MFRSVVRTVVSNNLAKRGDVIKYRDNEELAHDEKMSPMLEDINLLNVISEIDPIKTLKRLRDTAQTRNPVKLNPLSQISSAEFA